MMRATMLLSFALYIRMTHLTPLEDHVIVEPVIEQHTTKAGIVLPDTAKEKPQK